MAAMSRTKGATFERLIANMLSEATGSKWARRVRQNEKDSDIVSENPDFWHVSIECKHANTLALPAWWRQACSQAKHGQIPILVYRQTGTPIKVQVDAHHVNSATWPVKDRDLITMEWDTAMQWLREILK